MNEWKELKINDLPPDILTGDYEFSYNVVKMVVVRTDYLDMSHPLTILRLLVTGEIEAEYRKPEPKVPSHKQIMTKWWLLNDGWMEVKIYDNDGTYYINGDFVFSDFFIGKESADIPPEVK